MSQQEYDTVDAIKMKREKFTQQIRKQSLLEILKRKRVLDHQEEPTEPKVGQQCPDTFHEQIKICLEQVRAGNNMLENMSKINDLFNDQEGHIHQHTIDMFYPYFDSLVDLCDDAKFYPTISYMMYQIVFSTPYMAKSYTYYESPKLWKRIVKSIMNDDDYITFENWLFIILHLSYHSPVYVCILKDYIITMFQKKRENFNENIVSYAIKCFQLFIENKKVIKENELLFIEEFFIYSFNATEMQEMKLELYEFFTFLVQYAEEKEYWHDFFKKVQKSSMYLEAFRYFQEEQNISRKYITFLVLYTGFKQTYQDVDINLLCDILRTYNSDQSQDIDVRNVIYWVLGESLDDKKLSEIANSRIIDRIFKQIPKEHKVTSFAEISYLILKIVLIVFIFQFIKNKLDITCYLFKRYFLLDAISNLWNSRSPEVQKILLEIIVHYGNQLKYNNSYDKSLHTQFSTLKRELNDLGLMDQINKIELFEEIKGLYSAFQNLYDQDL